MNNILLSALVIVTMASCSKQVTSDSGQDDLQEIRLGSGISQTKVAHDGTAVVSGIQFLRKDAAATTNDYTGVTAISGSRATDGAITFANGQFYATSGNTYFASYYPAGSVSNNVVTWTIDGKTDIMTAATVDCGSNAVQKTATLAYQHQLAQIEVICKAVNDQGGVQTRWGNITSIKLLQTPATLTYAYTDLAVTSGANGSVALASNDYSTTFIPIAVPSSTNAAINAAGMFYPSASQTFDLEVTTVSGGAKTIAIDLGTGKKLERSQKHVVTLTFQATALGDIIVNSTIEQWTTGATGAGSVR